MTWWYWLVLGLVLIALEMASSGGFYIIFFGFAAVVVALAAAIGLAEPAWVQWLLFPVLSIASLLLFRNPLMRKLNLGAGAADIDTLEGETCTALEDMSAGASGRVELRGTTWSARNTGTTPLPRGHRCVVVRTDRLTLLVKPDTGSGLVSG
jgi:membrane protein implicated in regulation of membrane protease activity